MTQKDGKPTSFSFLQKLSQGDQLFTGTLFVHQSHFPPGIKTGQKVQVEAYKVPDGQHAGDLNGRNVRVIDEDGSLGQTAEEQKKALQDEVVPGIYNGIFLGMVGKTHRFGKFGNLYHSENGHLHKECTVDAHVSELTDENGEFLVVVNQVYRIVVSRVEEGKYAGRMRATFPDEEEEEEEEEEEDEEDEEEFDDDSD